jgi:hypothetical protein
MPSARLEIFGVIQEELGAKLKNDDVVYAICLSEYEMDDDH